jgi:hypothetical protein
VWGKLTGDLDRNNICAVAEASGPMCIITKWMTPGVKPVDGDTSGSQLTQILHTRKSNNVINGLSIADLSNYSKKALTEKYQVPVLIWSSRMDTATADSTRGHYLTLNTPQTLYIGAYSHGADHDADPFMPVKTQAMPDSQAQNANIADFFDQHLRGKPAPVPTK